MNMQLNTMPNSTAGFTRTRKILLLVNFIIVAGFTVRFIQLANYEFLGYIGVIVIAGLILAFTLRRVNYPDALLWGLSLWGLMHLSGGGIPIGDGQILYHWIIVPLFSPEYGIFRYDQLVHMIGFGFTAYLALVLLEANLDRPLPRSISTFLIIVMAGLGFGALNEMIEFSATLFLENTGVGGYINTSLDLVADFIGALIAAIILFARKPKIQI